MTKHNLFLTTSKTPGAPSKNYRDFTSKELQSIFEIFITSGELTKPQAKYFANRNIQVQTLEEVIGWNKPFETVEALYDNNFFTRDTFAHIEFQMEEITKRYGATELEAAMAAENAHETIEDYIRQGYTNQYEAPTPANLVSSFESSLEPIVAERNNA